MVVSPLIGHVEPVAVVDFINPVVSHFTSFVNVAEGLVWAGEAPDSVSLARQKLFPCLRVSRKRDVCDVGTHTLAHPRRSTNIQGGAA
jgi:hypothetical protein